MLSSKGLLANLLLASASTLGTLAVLEGVARLERAQHPRTLGLHALYVTHDPLLGWRLRPGAQAVLRTREFTVEISINRHGLRDVERSYEPAPGTLRILALGDSFVEGYPVPPEAAVSRVLESSLRKACLVEVINGGITGYSTDQEYLFYKTEGVRYSPRVVLLFFYYNDVLPNVATESIHTPKPLLRFRSGDPSVVNYPVAPFPTRSFALAPRRVNVDEPLAYQSALWEWVQERMKNAPMAYNRLAGLGLWRRIKTRAPEGHQKLYQRDLDPAVTEAWLNTARIFKALAEEVERHGARLLVIYIPNRMEVNDRDWKLTSLLYGMDDEHWDRQKVVRRLSRIGKQVGFPVLDLTPALRRAEQRLFGSPYYTYDPHWTTLGHEVAAREVEAFMRREGCVPGCGPTPGPSPID